jgi:methionyl-tRNA formyltransferase
MRVALISMDPVASVSLRFVAAFLQSPHEVVAVISGPATAGFGGHDGEDSEDAHDADLTSYRRFLAARAAPEPDQVLDRYPTLDALREVRAFPYNTLDDVRGVDAEHLVRASGAELLILPAAPLLPRSLFGSPRFGTINYHAGVAPWYRGTAALYRALRELDLKRVGYTLHLVDDGVDSGDIVHQEIVPVLADDSELTIAERCELAAAKAIVALVTALERDGQLLRRAQNLSVGRTYRGFPTAREWCELADIMQSDAWFQRCAEQRRGAAAEPDAAGARSAGCGGDGSSRDASVTPNARMNEK